MIIYTVKPGDNVYSIAREFGITPKIIAEVNGLDNPEKLSVGEALLLLIPKILHTVEEGETLFGISRKYGKTLKELYRNNPGLKGNPDVFPKDEIVIEYEGEENKKGILSSSGYAYTNIKDQSLDSVLPYLSSITPFSYGLTNTGNLVYPGDDRILERAKNYGVKPILLLTSLSDKGVFDNTLSSRLLNDEEMQDNILSEVLSTMNSKGYGALDVDFEFVYPEEREKYIEFIEKAKNYLAPYGYKVYVALAPKTSAEQKGLLYEAHDYSGLGGAADRVLLMTYEWGYTYGPAMAVAPLDKVEEVVNYALSEIPANKIILGIPNYGYDFTLPFVEGESKARSLSNRAAVALAFEKGAEILFDEKSSSPYFRYTENGTEHEVWFEDVRSIEKKLDLANSKGLFGVAYWNLMNFFTPNFSILNYQYDIRQPSEE